MPLALLGNLKFIAVGLIGLLALLLWVQTERVSNAKARVDLEQRRAVQAEADVRTAAQSAAANAQALEDYKQKLEVANAETAKALHKTATLNANLAQIRKELHDVAAKDDRPISPVLGLVAERLRRATADLSGSGGEGNGAVPGGQPGAVSIESIGPAAGGRRPADHGQ